MKSWFKDLISDIRKYLILYIAIKDKYRVEYKDLYRDLKRQFPGAYICVTDTNPRLIVKEDMEKLTTLNFAKYRKWTKETFDCENFARVLNGIMSILYGRHAFGTVRVQTSNGGHMLNCFIDEFGKFNFLEPQTDEIFKPKDRQDYKVRHIII